MENKHTGALSGVGFYATLVICLLAVGVGGYFLLFGGQETAQEEEEAPQTAVTAQAPEIPAEDPVETVSPDPRRRRHRGGRGDLRTGSLRRHGALRQ